MTKFQDIPSRPATLMIRLGDGDRQQFSQDDGQFRVSINASGSVKLKLYGDCYDFDNVEFNEDGIEYAAWGSEWIPGEE